jgi:hypothetical protein
MSDTEKERSLVNEMICSRAKSTGSTEVETARQILAQIAELPDDAPLICGTNPGDKVDARTVRKWASQHGTLEMTQ